jgi:hypothetical protein
MSELHRYKGAALPKHSYRNEISVECPKCKGEAIVTVKNAYYLNQAKLQCTKCLFSECEDDLIRYQVSINRNCIECGKKIEVRLPNNKEKVNELAASCSNCGDTKKYKTRNEEYIHRYNQGYPCDPVFELSLWFQCEWKGKILWAYNREHADEIHRYVSAKLRERQGTSYTSMAENLPTFIKQAKNRDAIVKALEKFLQK